MQIVYSVLVNDRHTDPKIILFYDKDKAIDKAREKFKDLLSSDPNDIIDEFGEAEYDSESLSHWLYFTRYSTEGDYISVEEAELW